MAIIPTSAVIGTAASALSTIPSIVEAGAGFRKSEKERLAELERRAAMGTLGFTSAQEDVLRRQLLAPAQALASQQMIDQRALTATTGGGAGQDFQAMLSAQEAEQRRLAEAQAKLTQADVELQLQQEAEMRKLASAQDEAKAKRAAAIIGGVADVGAQAFGAGLELRRFKELTGAIPTGRGKGAVESGYEDDFLGD